VIDMKSFTKINCAVFTVALAVLGCAQAGPQVSITFKNNGSSDAIYDFVGSRAYSYAEATPKPSKTINPGASDQFIVKGRLSADVTIAIFQYRTGMKTCKFKTSY